MVTEIILGISAAIQLGSAIYNGISSNKQANREDKQLDLQQQSLNESLRSNYYSYMQQLESMQNEYSQDQLAINQAQENIASNKNYLDRWASEYDQSMQSAVDETYSQYQSLASNYANGLVSNAETGRSGGSASRVANDAGSSLSSVAGTTDGFSLSSNRLGSYLQSTALDMLSDKQTAISSVGTSYKSIDSYNEAMEELTKSMSSMKDTTKDISDKLKEQNISV